jgi:hypothetical protein
VTAHERARLDRVHAEHAAADPHAADPRAHDPRDRIARSQHSTITTSGGLAAALENDRRRGNAVLAPLDSRDRKG